MSIPEDIGSDPAEKLVSRTEKKIADLRRRVEDAHHGDDSKGNLQELRRIEAEAHEVILNVGRHLETPSNRISQDELRRLNKAYSDAEKVRTRALESFMDKAATPLGLPEIE